ncbi:hypothetical protein M0802_011663 [Mischocyttarus mexicanus]|nr:hypothetical protein M0802_011663 [Mischocyttarus mexicanus]
MERYEEEADDSDNETDPEQLLNEWLGELDSLTVIIKSSKVLRCKIGQDMPHGKIDEWLRTSVWLLVCGLRCIRIRTNVHGILSPDENE